MFNSISNNFGAGVIPFKDVQESSYIVLNAKFTCSPQSAEYKAADVLEIKVPALMIARSTEAGVIVRFKDKETSYGYTSIYDGGTVAKSWIKDATTLCIEKLDCFDDQQELIIYIQTLYCQLGQGGNAIKGKERKITCVSEESFLRLNTSYTLCVIYDRWVFYHMMFSSCAYAYRDKDWEAFLENLPDDITADVPVISATNYRHARLGGITESHIEEGYWSMPVNERGSGFENTGNYVFSFGYLIRNYVDEPEVEGRLKYAAEQIQAGQYQIFYDFNLELIPSPAMAACEGRTGIYSAGPVTFSAPDCPEETPEFDAFFLAAHQHSNGLTVQMLEVNVRKSGSDATVKVTDLSGDNNLAFKLFDTAAAIRTSYSY